MEKFDFVDTMINIILLHGEGSVLTHMIEASELEIMCRRGMKDGRAAGSWVFDGNTSEEAKQKVQQGIEEGDPEVLDMLPSPRLGGEFADDPTWEQILREEGIRYDSEMDADGRQDLEDAYREQFDLGVRDEIAEATGGMHSF